ncbi:ABC transporter permease subunit [Oceanibacterium hippocampi]|uniref:Putrescine transport system permease protein PotH n=1 Tax=Oceanibacterium hippocampi TaxID=745714 RepID=A0A1Y5TT70_9PROT|nr:ABC transporter permease subunit [Oceanibacterium hippocampi]SLN71824.1 Putrescine transport system permease protein PotH [Oceanibacterium hippocampi]
MTSESLPDIAPLHRRLSGAWRALFAPDWKRSWPILVPLLFLGIFFVYPVADLLLLSFRAPDGALSLDQYAKVATTPVYSQVFFITFKIAIMVTVLCVAFGYPVAYFLANTTPKIRGRLILLVLVPFWTSFLVRTFSWMIILSYNGPAHSAVRFLLGDEAKVKLIYNMTGVMIGTTQALMPLAILVMTGAMQNIDRNLVDAAATMGARRGQAFWRIYFPLSMPGVAAAALLTFVTSLGFFITPALLGSPGETMIAQIILTQIQELLNWRLAGALSLILLIIALVVFAVQDRLIGSTGSTQSATATEDITALSRFLGRIGQATLAVPGWLTDKVADLIEQIRPPRADRPVRPVMQWVLRGFVTLVVLFLASPALVVIPVSFTAGNFIALPPEGFSLRWYETYLGSTLWTQATVLSLVIAMLAGILTTVLGTAAAFVLVRRQLFAKRLVLALFLSPLIVPRMVTAVALFYLFAKIGLIGTITGLVIGHTILALPYVVVTVMSVLKSYDVRLDQAAATLGASPLRVLSQVTLPLLKVGIISAFLFAFVTSFDELTIALFTSAGTVTTLPKAMWSDLILQANPTLAAVSTVILIIATVAVLCSEAVQRRARRYSK